MHTQHLCASILLVPILLFISFFDSCIWRAILRFLKVWSTSSSSRRSITIPSSGKTLVIPHEKIRTTALPFKLHVMDLWRYTKRTFWCLSRSIPNCFIRYWNHEISFKFLILNETTNVIRLALSFKGTSSEAGCIESMGKHPFQELCVRINVVCHSSCFMFSQGMLNVLQIT